MRLVLLASRSPAQPGSPAGVPPSILASRLGKTADSLSHLDLFSGVIVVVRNGERAFAGAYRQADRARHKPCNTETAFTLGSINEGFTATAVRQLAAGDVLHLDSTLIRHRPDYPSPAVARGVTIRQLLLHRSGIGGNIFAAPKGGSRADFRHNGDFLQLFVDAPLEFTPGQVYEVFECRLGNAWRTGRAAFG